MNAVDYIILGVLVITIIRIAMGIARRKKQTDGGCGLCRYRDSCSAKPYH